MDISKIYMIPIKGLDAGAHHFDFEVDSSLFEEYEGGVGIAGGRAAVSVDMTVTPAKLLLDVKIIGNVDVECDRCLDNLTIPIDYRGTLEVMVSENEGEYDGEVMWVNPSEKEFSLMQYIYESIALSIPYSRVHGEDAEGNLLCNKDMLSRFRIVSAEDFEKISKKADSLESGSEGKKLRELQEKMKKTEP